MDWGCSYSRQGADQLRCYASVAAHRKNGTVFAVSPQLIESATGYFERSSKALVRNSISTGFLTMYMLRKACHSVSAFGFCALGVYGQRPFHDYAREHEIYLSWAKEDKEHFKMYP